MGEALGMYIMTRWGFANIMLTELIATDLFLLTVCQLILVWHCFKGRGDMGQFTEFMTDRLSTLGDGLNETGAILEDIADALEQDAPSAPAALGGSPLESILGLVMNRAAMGSEHGTSKTNRPLHEENRETESEQIQGSGEHT